MHSPCSEAYFPISSFFSQAVGGCMEQQSPMQMPGAPWSPLIHCELPKGPHQALLHSAPPATLCPFGARHYAWDCVVPGCLLKNLGENHPVLRTALVMPRSPQPQLQEKTHLLLLKAQGAQVGYAKALPNLVEMIKIYTQTPAAAVLWLSSCGETESLHLKSVTWPRRSWHEATHNA